MRMLYLIIAVIAVYTITPAASDFRVVCYYWNEAQLRPGKAKFLPEDIDPSLCTHIIYYSAKAQGLQLAPTQPTDDYPKDNSMYTRVLKRKQHNPSLKVLLSIGRQGMKLGDYKGIAEMEDSRLTFSKNVVSYLRARNFDGFDIDWDYPTLAGGTPRDKTNFQLLVEKLRTVFEQDAQATGKPRLLLTVAVPSGKKNIDRGITVSSLSKVVDFMIMLTVDYHGSWGEVVGFNSPLLANLQESDDDRQLNVHWTARYYVTLGAPKEKLVITIPTVANTFTLKDPGNNKVFAPTIGPGAPGKYTNMSGVMAYYEVCDLINSGAKVVDDPGQNNRYLVNGNQWIGYDDKKSVLNKACYAKENGFGGVMFSSMDLDDFAGTFCNDGKYPLIRTAKRVTDPAGSVCSGLIIALASTSGGTQNIQQVALAPLCLCLGMWSTMWL